MAKDYQHCSMREAPRPSEATHRVLTAIYFELAPGPGQPPESSHALVVWLDRCGMSKAKGGNGTPRPPKRCTVDLRIGDCLLCNGCWARIVGARAFSSAWLTEAEAAAWAVDGYVYRPSGILGKWPALSLGTGAQPEETQ
jgi:hypothetical protein